MNDNQIEQEIQAKGLTAPRITPADIEANIVGAYYFTGTEGVVGAESMRKLRGELGDEYAHPSLGLLTFCVLVLRKASPSPESRPAPAPRTSTPRWAARSHGRTPWRRSGRLRATCCARSSPLSVLMGGRRVPVDPTTIGFDLASKPDQTGYWCVVCGRFLPADDCGVIVHDDVPHPEGMTFDEEESPQ